MNIMNKLKNNLSIVIMAAGKGTRMNSDLPKVLHELSGDTLLNHVIATAKKLHPTNTVVIVGHEAEIVKKSVLSNNVLFSLQKEQHGTGHAVIQVQQLL